MPKECPVAPQREVYPEPALHYKADPLERKTASGYQGSAHAALCGVSGAAVRMAPNTALVSCPDCLLSMETALRFTLSERQQKILQRKFKKAS